MDLNKLQDISDCLDIRAALYLPHRATSMLPFVISNIIKCFCYKYDASSYIFEAKNLAKEILKLDSKYVDSRMKDFCNQLFEIL